ncbi:MAG: putative lipid II flippase FtsW [Gammaproteobacteria bacterium]
MRARAAIPNDQLPSPDYMLLGVTILLLGLGLVMVTSTTITAADRQLAQPFYYLLRQTAYLGMGLVAALIISSIRLVYWERLGPLLLVAGLLLLVLVLIPGIGKAVNGSHRWLALGPVKFQPSELVKLMAVIYLAGYLVRHGEQVRNSISGFIRPMGVIVLIAVLLLMEPDFGGAGVISVTALGLMFLGGVRLWLFGVLVAAAGGALGVLAVAAPYRMERLTAFLNPWADPFNSGFQLTQALIAFGRGEWWGVGLGASIQKLFYLPEAHTDFLFAVLAEELGLAGAVAVILLFALLVWRAFALGRRAELAGHRFAAYLAYGLGLWIAFQSFINIGVNMGLLPTKGLTLPLLSYGGSSLVVTCAALALLWRIDYELREPPRLRARRVPETSRQENRA